jgi:hypothetical protein
MDERTRKIRYGLILQGCIEATLHRTSHNQFHVNRQYDEESMTPDFLLPSVATPSHFIEVTQTEARNSFQMKILRYFEAICEAKVFFGNETISVNVLMGNPQLELPASNIRALNGFFDVNLNPRNDARDEEEKRLIANLESAALVLAGEESIDTVGDALDILLPQHDVAISILAHLLEETLNNAAPDYRLFSLWSLERERVAALTDLNTELPRSITYKRPLIESLYLMDQEFEELRQASHLRQVSLSLLRKLAGNGMLGGSREQIQILRNVYLISQADFDLAAMTPNPANLSLELQARLETAGLIYIREGVSLANRRISAHLYVEPFRELLFERNFLTLKADLRRLIEDPVGSELRQYLKSLLDADPAIRWFFEDIRDEDRRLRMPIHFLQVVEQGIDVLGQSVDDNLTSDKYAGIEHHRCWMADLLVEYTGRSHNMFNRTMFQDPQYIDSLGNPFNNLTVRSQRLLAANDRSERFVKVAVRAFERLLDNDLVPQGELAHRALALRLLNLRFAGAIRLQGFNPLHILIEVACTVHGFDYQYGGTDNLLSDMASDIEALGRFHIYRVVTPRGTVLVNALYVDEYGGLDKAKEWSARGRTFLYHLSNGDIASSSVTSMIFVVDGPWHEHAIARLRAGGWDVCRPQQLNDRLGQFEASQ